MVCPDEPGEGDTCRTTACPIPHPIYAITGAASSHLVQAPPHSLRFHPIPPPPCWRLKPSKLFISDCFHHSDSALHCCHPFPPHPFAPSCLPFIPLLSPSRVFPRAQAFLIIWSLCSLVSLGSSSLHLSSRIVVPLLQSTLVPVLGVGRRSRGAREVLLLIAPDC